jgi:4-amino-4-deoxy-L-arabinose transferase-like glycosyltransferase
LLCSPMVAVIGSITTPDAPACFFQAAALAVALYIVEPEQSTRRGPLWLLFGILIGLSLASKYTCALLGASVFLALLLSREGRRHLFTPWPWLGAILAVAVFSPVIDWNSHHDWASFRFQLHHGLGSDHSPFWKNPLDYIGGQFAVCTPVLFILCIAVLFIYARRKNNPLRIQILLFSAVVPLLFFLYSSTRHHVEGNWPVFAYFPAVILVAVFLSENWTPRWVGLAELAIIVAFIATLVIHSPELVWRIAPKIGTPQWDHLFAWHELAVNEVQPQIFDSPVFTGDYEYAAELSFYLPGQTPVWPLPDPTRPTAFDFFPNVPNPQTFDRLVLVRRLPKGYDPPSDWRPLGPRWSYKMLSDPSQFKQGRQIRRSQVIDATK